jgi:superfamily II DNA or RNA helicase
VTQVAPAEPTREYTPNSIQREALEALRADREQGNQAGLVVLATGLGKTYLAAFDSLCFGRVLFVAHRNEILSQASYAFARVGPPGRTGLLPRRPERPRRASALRQHRHNAEGQSPGPVRPRRLRLHRD